ncbi:MAG: hypothetical protein M3Y87_31410 [Myxococcota bacterium]|nr:hypothetical protein [Myxococcota bacterium]
MSGCLMVYVVDLETLRRAVGSRDDALLARIAVQLGDPHFDAAARELIHGMAPYISEPDELAVAHQGLCGAIGRELANGSVCPTTLTALEPVMEYVSKLGLGVDLFHLMYRGAPVPLPRVTDFPSTGYWTTEEVITALAVYRSAQPQHDDPDIDAVLLEIGEWLELAASLRRGLVAFYS